MEDHRKLAVWLRGRMTLTFTTNCPLGSLFYIIPDYHVVGDYRNRAVLRDNDSSGKFNWTLRYNLYPRFTSIIKTNK